MSGQNGNTNSLLQQGLEWMRNKQKHIMSSIEGERNNGVDIDNNASDRYNSSMPIKNGKNLFEGFGLPAASQVDAKNNSESVAMSQDQTQLQQKISYYSSAYNMLADKTTEYLTDLSNNRSPRNYNVFINRTAIASERNYTGCYTKGNTALIKQDDFNANYSANINMPDAINACQLWAIDSGKSYFGISRGENNAYQCYTGDSNTRMPTENDKYTVTKIASVIVENNTASQGGLFKNGQVGITTSDNDQSIRVIKTANDIPSGFSKCGLWTGGGINQTSLTATYGLNCSGPNYSTILSAVRPNFALDQYGASANPGNRYIVWDLNNNSNQQFAYDPVTKQLRIQNNGGRDLCLEAQNAGKKTALVVQNECTANKPSQQWIFQPDAGQTNTGKLIAKHTIYDRPPQCMDVANSSRQAGTNVRLWDCNGTNAQRWTSRIFS